MSYEKIGTRIGKLVQEKNIAYGDSFHNAADLTSSHCQRQGIPD